MYPSAREIESISWREHGVDDGFVLEALGDRVPVVGERLRNERIGVHRLVDGPVLVALALQYEHVVDVVVRIERTAFRRRDVGVGLHRVPQIVDHAPDEVDERWRQHVQSLKYNRCTRSELVEYLRRVHLVGYLGAEPARSDETILSKE